MIKKKRGYFCQVDTLSRISSIVISNRDCFLKKNHYISKIKCVHFFNVSHSASFHEKTFFVV